MKYHYIREQVSDNELKVTRIHTKDNAVDIFTKPLSHGNFECFRYLISLRLETDTSIEEVY
jgi:hypothetical protein